MWWAQQTELSQGWSIKSSWVRFVWPPEMGLVYSSLSCLLKKSPLPSALGTSSWKMKTGQNWKKKKGIHIDQNGEQIQNAQHITMQWDREAKNALKINKMPHTQGTDAVRHRHSNNQGRTTFFFFLTQWEHSLATEKRPREARSKGNIQLLNPSSSPRTNRFSHRKKRVQSISGNTDHSAQRAQLL